MSPLPRDGSLPASRAHQCLPFLTLQFWEACEHPSGEEEVWQQWSLGAWVEGQTHGYTLYLSWTKPWDHCSGSPQRNMEPDYKLFSLHPGLSCLCAVVHLLFTWNDLPSACPRRPHFQRPIPILPFLWGPSELPQFLTLFIFACEPHPGYGGTQLLGTNEWMNEWAKWGCEKISNYYEASASHL